MTLPVVILAGGKATRLYPLTKNKPKSLILIDGKPFIEHQLELLVKNGIKEVVLCIGHFGEKIKDRIGNGHSFGLHIEYSRDIDRGTGGAIKKALYLLGEQFGVLYGDSYLEINYRKIMKHFQEKTYMGLMTIFSNKICQDENNVVVDDGLVTRYEKKLCKEYVDYGFGIFKSKIFEHILLGDVFDLSSVYRLLIVNHHLSVYEIKKPYHEIGSKEGLRRLRHKFYSKVEDE